MGNAKGSLRLTTTTEKEEKKQHSVSLRSKEGRGDRCCSGGGRKVASFVASSSLGRSDSLLSTPCPSPLITTRVIPDKSGETFTMAAVVIAAFETLRKGQEVPQLETEGGACMGCDVRSDDS